MNSKMKQTFRNKTLNTSRSHNQNKKNNYSPAQSFSIGIEKNKIKNRRQQNYLQTEFTNDNDITTNYYLEALSTAIKRANYNRELLGIGEDISWLNTVKDYITLRWRDEDTELDFQYRMQSVGYLFVLDEIATLCAALSVPKAPPLTTVIPRSDKS